MVNGPSKKVIPYLYKERKKPLKAQIGKKTISIYFPKMTISSVSSDKSLTSNDGYEKGQQDTKKAYSQQYTYKECIF